MPTDFFKKGLSYAGIKIILNFLIAHFRPVFSDSHAKSIKIFFTGFVVWAKVSVGECFHPNSFESAQIDDVGISSPAFMRRCSAVFLGCNMVELPFCYEIGNAKSFSIFCGVKKRDAAALP